MLSGGIGMAALGSAAFLLHEAFDEWRATEAIRIRKERGVAGVAGVGELNAMVGEGWEGSGVEKAAAEAGHDAGDTDEGSDDGNGNKYGEELFPSWFPLNMKLRAPEDEEGGGDADEGGAVSFSAPPAR